MKLGLTDSQLHAIINISKERKKVLKMTMNIETKEVLTLHLTEEEIEILETADKILLKVQALLEGLDKGIMALETGEVINYMELARARGIIGGIAENVAWELGEID